jgi:hypothetical protein
VDYGYGAHVPRYSPGFSALLVPVVAVGGVGAAVMVPYVCALLAGCRAALVAWRLAGLLAGALAAPFVLLTGVAYGSAQSVMTEAPAAALALLMVWLLMRGGARAAGAAGLLAGLQVWLRPANGVLLLAGLAAISARCNWRQRAVRFLAGAAPLLLGLALWQWAVWGSPLTTGYQVAGVGAEGGRGVGSLFGLRFVLAPTHARSGPVIGCRVEWPNAGAYAAMLAGYGGCLSWPGVGVLGVAAPWVFLRRPGPLGAWARFAAASMLATLAVYLPYFFQDSRFLVVPAVLGNVGAAVLLAVGSKRWLFASVSAHRWWVEECC